MACLFKMKRYHVILVRGSEIGQERIRQRGKEGRKGRKRGETERNKQRREDDIRERERDRKRMGFIIGKRWWEYFVVSTISFESQFI